ncbi:MAG TPA: putative baseplate assembly protein [Allosphingosinicella sp.]|jgi:hypothetical protein
MPLQPPRLDHRTFDDLVREARERIPRFTPEWTNLNDSDPGMTLVKLQAWLTDTILFELNRLPEKTYIEFLNLLHVEPRPARAARAELQFRLAKLKAPTDPLTVPIPKGAAVDVDDPDLASPVTFETERSIVALNAAPGAVIVPRPGGNPLELVTTYDDSKGEGTFLHAFRPFGLAPSPSAPLLIGLALRPILDPKQAIGAYSQDVLPAIELDLFVDMAGIGDPDSSGSEIEGPLLRKCLGAAAAEQTAAVRWQIYSGGAVALDTFPVAASDQWTDLPLRGDDTAGLARTGHLRLQLPERATRFSPEVLPQGFFEQMGLIKPPTLYAELKALLRSGDTDLVAGLNEDHWTKMGLPEEHLNAVVNECTEDSQVADKLDAMPGAVTAALVPAALTPEEWVEIDPRLAVLPTPRHQGVARPLYWIRAVPFDAGAGSGLISAIRVNTVPATAAATRLAERLGASDGRPTQRFTLSKTPVLIDPETGAPDLELAVEEAGDTRGWKRVDDFYAQASDAEIYTLDPVTGTIAFAPRGRVPIAGATVTASRYRTGGGTIGNVGAGTITRIKGSIRNVDSVVNPRAATGGMDSESLEETLLRAPHDLRARDRAVTAEDFADLASSVPGVAVQRAFALANRRTHPTLKGQFQAQAGAVSLVVLPISDDPTPQPSDAQLRAICEYLDERRLITTELYLTGPRYVALAKLQATVAIAQSADLGATGSAASEALIRFLHPLYGGRDGRGWPFGAPIDLADLYDRLLSVPDVRRVTALTATMEATSPDSDPVLDVIGIPEGSLPWLRPERISLNVVYDSL